MPELEINQKVRLTRAVPELELDSGSEGVVRSVWFAPTPAYEVEFQTDGPGGPGGPEHATRALLDAEQLELAAARAWEK